MLLYNVEEQELSIQWNLSNPDTNGAEESVIVSEVSSFQRLQEWYLGWEKVPCLERCPQFRSVFIERERERGSTEAILQMRYSQAVIISIGGLRRRMSFVINIIVMGSHFTHFIFLVL